MNQRFISIIGVGIFLGFLATVSAEPLADNSLYLVKIPLVTQQDNKTTLELYRGHPVLISMFYGSCPDVCPLLIMGMQNYERKLAAKSQQNLRGLLVSFDAARDHPKQLQAIATMHRTDPKRWTFSSTDEVSARKLAALLNVQYRHKLDGTFDHSVEIALLDAEGRIVAHTSKLDGDQDFIAALREATNHP